MCFALYSIEYTEIQSFQTQILSGIYPQVQIESAYTQVENEYSNRYFVHIKSDQPEAIPAEKFLVWLAD